MHSSENREKRQREKSKYVILIQLGWQMLFSSSSSSLFGSKLSLKCYLYHCCLWLYARTCRWAYELWLWRSKTDSIDTSYLGNLIQYLTNLYVHNNSNNNSSTVHSQSVCSFSVAHTALLSRFHALSLHHDVCFVVVSLSYVSHNVIWRTFPFMTNIHRCGDWSIYVDDTQNKKAYTEDVEAIF